MRKIADVEQWQQGNSRKSIQKTKAPDGFKYKENQKHYT